MTAVVTDAHYRMAVALIRDLGEAGIRVVACDCAEVGANPGFASKYAARTVSLPREGYGDALYALCRDLSEEGERPALLPVGAGTLALLGREGERFRAVCGLAAPTGEQLDFFNDKEAVARLAVALGVPTPGNYPPGAVPGGFPLVVKPRCGERFGLRAEERYRIVRGAEALAEARGHFAALTGEDPLVEEYLPGEGGGCSVLCREGTVLAHICHRRVREWPVSGGPSSACEVIEAPELLEWTGRIVKAKNFTGVAMFEFKRDAEGGWRLLEVNPRVWGTYPLTRVSGSNFARVWYAAAMGEVPSEFVPGRPVRMTYFPSDLAAMLGYLRRGKAGMFFEGLRDLFRPGVKDGLRERGDRGPMRAYLKALRERR